MTRGEAIKLADGLLQGHLEMALGAYKDDLETRGTNQLVAAQKLREYEIALFEWKMEWLAIIEQKIARYSPTLH